MQAEARPDVRGHFDLVHHTTGVELDHGILDTELARRGLLSAWDEVLGPA